MVYLKAIHRVKRGLDEHQSFPFDLPLVKTLEKVEFTAPVTIFVGENGTGKSTLLEAIAIAARSITVGWEEANSDQTLSQVRKLSDALKLVWQFKTRKGFFLRSEDFFNFTKRLSGIRTEALQRLRELDAEYDGRSSYALGLAKLPYHRSLAEMESRYGEDLDANSHGESFLKLFKSRFVPGGLYLMDEPEAPLSPMRQLALISMIKEMVEEQDAQFIIATHSPILMAFPGADIYSFDQLPIRHTDYQDLEHVSLTRDFLNNPEQFLRHL